MQKKVGVLAAEGGVSCHNQESHQGFAQIQGLNNLAFFVILCQRAHAARAVYRKCA